MKWIDTPQTSNYVDESTGEVIGHCFDYSGEAGTWSAQHNNYRFTKVFIDRESAKKWVEEGLSKPPEQWWRWGGR